MSSTAIDIHSKGGPMLSAQDLRAQVNAIQQVMKAVMQPNVHYGIIKGTNKPTLYKPGAEVLATTFRIAVSYQETELSDGDAIRYRVRCIGTHQTTGIVLGEGIGECSSNEEKYKWRRAICDEEYDDTPETRKRVKYSKYQGNVEKTKQIRTEPADIANTVLKMAAKRAQVAMTLNCTAASDLFTQDIEDLPEHLRPEEEPVHKRTEKPPYAEDAFKKNFPKWEEMVQSGEKDKFAIIATLESRFVLSDEQRKVINDIKLIQQESESGGDDGVLEGDAITEEEFEAGEDK